MPRVWRTLADPRARLLASTLAWPKPGDLLVGRLVRTIERRDRTVKHFDFGGRLPFVVQEMRADEAAGAPSK